MRLISERIDVECEGEVRRPVSFTWRKQIFEIATIIRSWQDYRFSGGAPRKKTWRLRHHRNYFAVRTIEGRIFEIYLDRGTAGLVWVLYREVQDEPGGSDAIES